MHTFCILPLVLHKQTWCKASTKPVWTAVTAARLVDYLQMVEYLKCIVRWCIKFFGDQKGGQTPSNPPAYVPDIIKSHHVYYTISVHCYQGQDIGSYF